MGLGNIVDRQNCGGAGLELKKFTYTAVTRLSTLHRKGMRAMKNIM